MKIQDNKLIFDDCYEEALPKLKRAATVRAWSVPTAYRESGYFVAVTPHGEPAEIPACDESDVEFLGELELPASQDLILERAKAERLEAVVIASNAFMNAVTREFSDYEKGTWQEQAANAEALAADPDAPAPFLRRLAARRGVDVFALAAKVRRNVAVAAVVTPDVLGQQQAYEDKIKAAETLEELMAIEFDFALPELSLAGEGA